MWLFGYILGFVLFPVVPVESIGLVIFPIASVVTLWVLLTRIRVRASEYLVIAIAWTAIAIVFDYVFLVQLLRPEDGYYKADVYLYYALTFALPLLVGWYRRRMPAR